MASAPDTCDALYAIGELLDREVALDELLRTMIRCIARTLDADRGSLFLVDRLTGELFTKVAELPEDSEVRLKAGQGVAGHVAATGETLNVPTTRTEARFYRGVDERTGYETRSILAVPVRDGRSRIIGVFQLLNKRAGRFTRDDEIQLGALAAQAGAAIEATTLYASLQRDPEDPRSVLPVRGRFNRILGESPAMREAYRITSRAAESEATVLVRGETGTGKELFARAVHVNSRRRDGPFVKVDCVALPGTLIENELFGHERGAFTGADQRTSGKVQAAAGGTLFLDEIGELPLASQAKLLGVLQDRSFHRVGGTQAVPADVRVVAATNRDLEAMVEQGRFRADLYYRVKVVEIALPPLRERGVEDISWLARHFLTAAARRHGRPEPTLSEAAWARLVAHRWPGNVRELEHCLESALIIAEGGLIRVEDLSLPAARRPGTSRGETERAGPAPEPQVTGAVPTLAEVERRHIVAVLAEMGGNRSRAARLLDIGRNTLTRKLRAYGLDA